MKSEDKFIKMRDGVELRIRVKEKGSPVWIVATHGIGEHLGRHQYLGDLFGADFNVLTYDLRGHGRSQGRPAYISNFYQFMEDLSDVINYLRDKYRMKRYVLFGHSMGALITCGYVQSYTNKDYYPDRVVINAPPVAFAGPAGILASIIPKKGLDCLARIPVSIRISGILDLNYLSHQAGVKPAYLADPLNHLSLHTKLLFELARTAKAIFSRPLRPECPMYCSYGSEDRMVGIPGLESYFTMVEKAVILKCIEGSYHEIHNEIDKYRLPYFQYLTSVIGESRYHE